MNQEEFIEVIKNSVANAAVLDVIETLKFPPGRRPAERAVKLSTFYNQLSLEQQQQINEIIHIAVDASVFGFLCIIDGVRSINDLENQGSLKLTYKDEDGIETLLNDPEENYLHDIYKAE